MFVLRFTPRFFECVCGGFLIIFQRDQTLGQSLVFVRNQRLCLLMRRLLVRELLSQINQILCGFLGLLLRFGNSFLEFFLLCDA